MPYCFKCKNKTESKISRVVETKNGRRMLYETALFEILKNQDLSKSMKPVGLLSSLGIKTPLSKISLVVPRLF